MRDTYYEIYVHIVWCTKNKEQMLNEDMEKIVYSAIQDKARKHKATVIANGNTMDHVHLLLSISPDTNIAILVKEIKGSTSFHINNKTEGNLYWQDGYGVLSVSKSGVEVVKRYVENQKNHHESNKDLIDMLEKYA